jgi:threonine dehydrogenase-like Zn-dependent dehydrogenase
MSRILPVIPALNAAGSLPRALAALEEGMRSGILGSATLADHLVQVRLLTREQAALECSGHPSAQAACIEVLAPGGRVVVVGMGGQFSFSAETLIRSNVTLVGHLVCKPYEFYDVLSFAALHVDELRGLVGPRLTIEDVDKALEHAQDGGQGKVVFDWT